MTELQSLRAKFAPGDEVLVERRAYAGRQTIHRGEIVEKQPQVAIVRFAGRKGRTREEVPYQRLRKVPGHQPSNDGSEVLRAVPPALSALAPPQPPQPTAPLQVQPTVQLQAPQAVAAAINPEITAWLEMGVALADTQRAKIRQLRKESEELADQAQKLTDASDSKLEEARSLETQLEGLVTFSELATQVLQ